jgi:hypothetical protein
MKSITHSKAGRGRVRRVGFAGLAAAGIGALAASVALATSISAVQHQLQPYFTRPSTIGKGFTKLPKAPPKGKVVVYLGTSEVSNAEVASAVKQVAALAGWKYHFVSYDAANPATFISAMNTAVAEHANYVMEAGTPLPSAVINTAKAHHIKIALDAVYPGSVSGPVIDISDGHAQDDLMGRMVADEFIVDSGGKGKAVEEAVPQYPILTAFSQGFQSQVRADCPKCKISVANVSIPQLQAGQLNSVVVGAVRSHPGYNYLVSDDGPFFEAIVSALSAQGIHGEKILGEAGDAAGITGIKNGTELAWTGYSVVFAAWEMMDAAFHNAEGKPVPAADATQPTQMITKSNAGGISLNPNIGGWNYPTNGLQQLERLWHL